MKRNYIIIAAVILIIVLVNIALYPKVKENSIRNKIDRANYCDVDSDCKDAGQKCPFGCYNYVNKNEVEDIRNLLNGYDGTKCVYGCIQCENVQCIDSKCVEVCD